MADIEESNKRPLEVEGDDQEAETAAKKTKVDEAPADSDATEETGSSAVADDVTETAAVSEAAAADEADKKTSEEEKKPAEDSSAAPKAENTASAPKFGSKSALLLVRLLYHLISYCLTKTRAVSNASHSSANARRRTHLFTHCASSPLYSHAFKCAHS